MKVIRVLNNNVLLGEDGITYLLMGLSIGFKKKAGERIPSDAIEKMFVLSSPDSAGKLQEMMRFIPEEYFVFSSDVLLFIRHNLKREYSDNLYIMLTDHIYAAVERYRQRIPIKNALLTEVKKFYKDEYATARMRWRWLMNASTSPWKTIRSSSSLAYCVGSTPSFFIWYWYQWNP